MIPEDARIARARVRAGNEKNKTTWDQIVVLMLGMSALVAFVIL